MAVAQRKESLTLDHAIASLGAELGEQTFATPARFTFRWAGLRFQGKLQSLATGQSELELTARLGLLPFSAEDQAARSDVLQALSRHFAGLDGTYLVTPRGEIQCVATTVFDGPVRAASVTHCLTVSLLHLRNLLGRFRGLLIAAA